MSEQHEPSDDIAIIGMSGRFPGAPDLRTFWRNLQGGVDSIGHFSEEELIASGLFPLDVIRHPDFIAAKGVLDDAEMFDAAFFGISPREAELMDPQHRLLMECAWHALEDAGYDSERYPGRIAAFTSTGLNTYMAFNICSHPGLAQRVGGFHLSICNDKDFVATRIAYAMNLKGASLNISTACSSSLVSVHFACQHLLTHQSDISIVGAVSVHFPQKVGHIYEAGAAYSPDGLCRPFDSTPSGLIDGSGVAAVVLKRLDDALRDGDAIYAVVKGTAVNNDGRNKVGYTAPSIEGQSDVISEALEMAGVEADTISYVEAHGTATPLGDPIEVAGLTQAYQRRTARTGFCGLGSVKSNIGHADTAAGLAGLMKVVLGMQHGQMAPSLHFKAPNPELHLEQSPFYVVGELTDWPSHGEHPRRAGLSSFGVGGTNAHAIIEEAPARPATAPARPDQLLIVSAKTPAALQAAVSELSAHLKANPRIDLADVAHTLQVGRRQFARRAAVTAQTVEEAIAALDDPKCLRMAAADHTGTPVSFMFPGQGSQHPGMTRSLYEREASFRRDIDRCADLLKPALGLDLRRLLFAGGDAAGSAASELQQTAIAQPALFTVEYALAQLWMRWGVRPAAMIGHSIGEYVAACISGVFSLPDALSVVATRGRLMQGMQPGAMIAVLLPEHEVQPLLGGGMEIAAVNSPSTCVVSGALAAAEAFESELKRRNISCQRLHTSHAFHSSMMEPMLAPFVEALGKVRLNAPTIPFVSNRTGSWITAEDAVRPQYWADHLRHAVRFSAGLVHLLRETPSTLLEVGPGRALSGLAKQAGADIQPRTITSLPHASETRDDQQAVVAALGELWLTGASIDWQKFHDGERRLRVSLPGYPFQRQRYWIEPRITAIGNEASASAVPAAATATGGDQGLERYARPDLDSEYAAPRNQQESALAEIWQELLGVNAIGIHDNFFDLGGHSLVATQILARLKQDHGATLELNALFQHQTIADLAAAWGQQSQGQEASALAALLEQLEHMSEEEAESLLADQRQAFDSAHPSTALGVTLSPSKGQGKRR
jgi:phthiocerol/phenolphthiocerol synthesis type-I polyketide synthase E